jgi:hypothetical protein
MSGFPEGYFGDYVELPPTSFTFGIQTDDGQSSPLAQSLNTFTSPVRKYLWRAADILCRIYATVWSRVKVESL